MAEEQIAKLLDQANQAAQGEDWDSVSDILNDVLDQHPAHTAALTGLGISKLHQDDPQSAVDHFQEVVSLNPHNPEAYNNLGVAHALQSEWDQAEVAYQEAINQDPEHAGAWKNLAEVYLQQNDRLTEGVQILAAVIKKNPRDTEALSMLASCYEEVGDRDSAALLYEQVLEVDPGHALAAARLEQIRPAQQAPQIARPEHVEKLAALKNLTGGNGKAGPAKEEHAVRAVAFYGPSTFSFQRRMNAPARALAAAEHDVKLSSEWKAEDLDRYQAFIFNRPHVSQAHFQALTACVEAGKPVIVDLDLDYAQLPETHPEYDSIGPGNPEAMARLDDVYGQVKHFTVPHQHLAERLQPEIGPAAVVPTGWIREDSRWEMQAPSRDTINFGIISTHVNVDYPEQIRKGISDAVREVPEAVLVAAGDYQLLAAFDDLPEDKKMFIPLGSFQDYPYTLAHFDVLLVPEQVNEFTETKADLPLLEAGIRRIPWLATRLPAYWDWGVGGQFVSQQGWKSALVKIAQNPEERESLGRAGFEKAKQREGQLLVNWWKAEFEKS